MFKRNDLHEIQHFIKKTAAEKERPDHESKWKTKSYDLFS